MAMHIGNLTHAIQPSDRYAYSISEAARAISLSRRMLYNLIDTGALRTVKLGRRRLVPRSELERLCSPA